MGAEAIWRQLQMAIAPKWPQPQMASDLNGYSPKRLQHQMATAPNGHSPKWPQPQMATTPNGYNPKWPQPQMATHMSARNHLSHRRPAVWGGTQLLTGPESPMLARTSLNRGKPKNGGNTSLASFRPWLLQGAGGVLSQDQYPLAFGKS